MRRRMRPCSHAAEIGIKVLNTRHGADRFFLFHRARALERRRTVLDGMGAEARQAARVQPAAARRRRYQLHRAARRSRRAAVGAIRHHARHATRSCRSRPAGRWSARCRTRLNRPRFDPTVQRVTEGYGILQPRVAVSVVSANRSRVLADLLGPRRHRSVHDRGVRRLSGSLPRGQLRRQGHLRRRRVRARRSPGACRTTRCSATTSSRGRSRAPALCTDIHVIDDYPAHYLSFAARQHRWVRGDWQIARWIWRTVRDAHGAVVRQHAAGDRALEDPRQPAAQPDPAGAGRAADRGLDRPPGSPALWTTLALLVIAFPAYTQLGRSRDEPPAPGFRCASTSAPSATTSSAASARRRCRWSCWRTRAR